MKSQATPSLILEKYELTDDHRLNEADKWLSQIAKMFEISKTKYKNLEVIFRQLLIHPKMNTAFAYQFDEPFKIPTDPTKIKSEINLYLAKIESRTEYCLHKLDLEKKERIKSAELSLKNQYASIKKIEDFARQIKGEKSLISEKDLVAPIQALRTASNDIKWVHRHRNNVPMGHQHSVESFAFRGISSPCFHLCNVGVGHTN